MTSSKIQFDYANLPNEKLGHIKIHFAHAGKDKNKPLLLCVHGFPEFWYTWHQQLEALSDEFFVVAPDLRGFNFSDKPQGLENYTLQELVEDALALVKHLGYEKFTLVGHDWGGLMSWTLATLYPEVLNKLIIINSPHPRIHQKLLTHSQRQQTSSAYVEKFMHDSAIEKLSRNNFDLLWRFAFNDLVEKGVFTENQMDIYKPAWAQEGALKAGMNLYRANTFTSGSQFLEPLANKVQTDTLVLWGMDDTALSPECLDDLSEYVASLKTIKIPGAGHCVIHERSELITQQIRAFTT